MIKTKKSRGQFSTVSLPTPLVAQVERIVKNFKYWPTKTDFIREAVLEKIEKYTRSMEANEHRNNIRVHKHSAENRGFQSQKDNTETNISNIV